jgi:hypothetical protein
MSSTQQSPELKAKELFDKYMEVMDDAGSPYAKDHAKEAAIICVEMLINEADGGTVRVGRGGLTNVQYWESVKSEISKL